MNIKIEQIKPNFTKINIGTITVWFSYETPIAFQVDGQPLVVRENVWSTTTGKHLNAIDGGDKEAKARRVSSEVFESLVEELGMHSYKWELTD